MLHATTTPSLEAHFESLEEDDDVMVVKRLSNVEPRVDKRSPKRSLPTKSRVKSVVSDSVVVSVTVFDSLTEA